jgi:ATP/maltotriose-dependent transcriptional regulator MalT
LNLPILIYLGYFLSRHAQAEPLAVDNSEKLHRLCGEYGISRREQEVFLLLLSGRSNQEIEAELYISLKTVKAHVYNVYQKFGVNSRLKLANLVRVKLQDNSQTPAG